MTVRDAYLAVYPDDEDHTVVAQRIARQRAMWTSALRTLLALAQCDAQATSTNLAMSILNVEFCELQGHVMAIVAMTTSAEVNGNPHLATVMLGLCERQKAVADQLDTWAAEVAAMKH